MTSDELTAVCPITGQPDFYVATIDYDPAALCLESKSLKALAVQIRDETAAALELPPGKVRVTLRQKARGGIAIVATA